jgi:competence protein CoiA
MKFAKVCGKRTKATKGAIGFCPACDSEMVAKCGSERIHHWAHKGTRHCDRWWEPETEWHRAWKEHFPEDWQEVVQYAEDGEKHIADVKISNDLVIECQHSHINPEERASREKFYKNMIWVVDGTRLKRDYPRFIKVRGNLRRTSLESYFLVAFPEEYFPSAWLGSKVPVIFDFLGTESISDNNEFALRNNLYCLFPERKYNNGILAIFSRELFIEKAVTGELSIFQPTITVKRKGR